MIRCDHLSAHSAIKRERETEKTHVYTKHRQNAPDRSPRPRPSSSSFRRTFCRPLLSVFLANPRKRQRETETERKGFVVTKLELNSFPKRLKFSKLLFLHVVTKIFLSLSLLYFVSKTSDFFFEFPYRRNHFQRRIRWLPSTCEEKTSSAGKARLYSSPTSCRARRRVRGSRTRLKRQSVETNPR